MKKIFVIIALGLIAVACSSLSNSGREPAAFYNVPEKFEGQDFFKKYGGVSAASLVGKHKIATFIDWVRNNPIPLYKKLRDEAPLFEIPQLPNVRHYVKDTRPWKEKTVNDKTVRYKDPYPKTLVVTLDEDVRDVLNHPKVFSTRLYRAKMEQTVGKFMMAYDKQEVNKEKAWMRQMLRRDDLPKIKAKVKRLTEKAIQEGNVNGRIEIVNAIARKVPIDLTGEYFGFPGPDKRSMYRWSRATQYSFFHNAVNKKIHEKRAIETGKESRAYLRQLLKEKRASQDYLREDTILARLLKMNVPDGEMMAMYDGRVVTNILGTLVGGVETTQAAITQVVQFFIENPEIMEGAREAISNSNDRLFEQFVWEALRFRPVNPFVIRYAESDYVLGKDTSREYHVKKGQVVLVATHSAMFDPAKVKNPDEFRTNRGDVNAPESVYYHFGYGHHKCLGDYIAQVQVPEIVKQIIMLPGVRPVDSFKGKITYSENISAFDKQKSKDKSPFPESYLLDFDIKTRPGEVTIADPRFVFEDYLMDYDRHEYRVCLGNYKSKSSIINFVTTLPGAIIPGGKTSSAHDLFLCRLPKEFRSCMKDNKKSKDAYDKCNKHLSEREKFFYDHEIHGGPLDISKIPGGSVVNNTGYEFEEVLKFYDRFDMRGSFKNPLGLSSFKLKDPESSKKLIFYTRVNLPFRKCIGKKVLIARKDREKAFNECMSKPEIAMDSVTEKYYRKIILEQ
jgi:cytochrome P450